MLDLYFVFWIMIMELCAICLEPIGTAASVEEEDAPCLRHSTCFHRACLTNWVASQTSLGLIARCPLCGAPPAAGSIAAVTAEAMIQDESADSEDEDDEEDEAEEDEWMDASYYAIRLLLSPLLVTVAGLWVGAAIAMPQLWCIAAPAVLIAFANFCPRRNRGVAVGAGLLFLSSLCLSGYQNLGHKFPELSAFAWFTALLLQTKRV